MKHLTLYNDANEKFKYKLTLEGAKIEDTSSRLCLEFDSGENIYFKGKLDQAGNCIVNIKALKHFEGKGNAKIEVIADKTYFTIHEMPFEVKKKVDVKFESVNNDFDLEIENEEPKVGISFERVTERENVKETPKIKEPMVREPKEMPKSKKERIPMKKEAKPIKEDREIKGFMDFINS